SWLWKCPRSRWAFWPRSPISPSSSACGPYGSSRGNTPTEHIVIRRIEPYWYAIVLVLALAAGLFIYHLATGITPPRAAVNILGFPIYWYGIWIVTGIGLGAWVVARLATGRARIAYEAAVPPETRDRPLDEELLP